MALHGSCRAPIDDATFNSAFAPVSSSDCYVYSPTHLPQQIHPLAWRPMPLFDDLISTSLCPLSCATTMLAGDWLQGPYVYHLYEHYGFSVRDIGRLFIMGFGSSAVFGTLAGAMADYR